MMYILKTKYDQSVIIKSVTNNDDSVSQSIIQVDPDNTDYQAYLKWVSEGNTPYPADSATPTPADEVTE